MVALAHRLMGVHGGSSRDMALISPHRAQNNAILKRLGEMMADTVESTDMKDLSLPLMDTVEGTRGQSGTLSYLG